MIIANRRDNKTMTSNAIITTLRTAPVIFIHNHYRCGHLPVSSTERGRQWLNYSKGGGGTLHFVPSLPFLPQSSPSFPSSHPLRSRPAPFQRFWESAVISPSGVWGGAPAEIVFGAFIA